MHNQVNLTREFDTGDIVIVSKQVKSIIKDGVSPKQVFKTKGTYRVMEKDKPSSYWLLSFPFCEGLGRPGIKVK